MRKITFRIPADEDVNVFYYVEGLQSKTITLINTYTAYFIVQNIDLQIPFHAKILLKSGEQDKCVKEQKDRVRTYLHRSKLNINYLLKIN